VWIKRRGCWYGTCSNHRYVVGYLLKMSLKCLYECPISKMFCSYLAIVIILNLITMMISDEKDVVV